MEFFLFCNQRCSFWFNVILYLGNGVSYSINGELASCSKTDYSSFDFDCDKYSPDIITKAGNDIILVKYCDKDAVNGTLPSIDIKYEVSTGKVIDVVKSEYDYEKPIYIK